MSINKDDFRKALSCFASGVTVVTLLDGNNAPQGLTVSAFCSVSLDPPLILVCIDKGTSSHQAIAETGLFVVNILAEEQRSISEQFALSLPDKFEGVDHSPGIDRVPVLNDALTSLECSVRNAYDGGDHTIFVGDVHNIRLAQGKALVYYNGEYLDLYGEFDTD